MNKIKIILIFLLIGFIISSCKDWLNLGPEDGITRDEFWNKQGDVVSAVMGCYASMIDVQRADGTNNSLVERLFLWGELRGDMVSPSTKVPDSYRKMINGDIMSDNPVTSWAMFYKTIKNCNVVLKYAHKAKLNDLTFTEEEQLSLESEALAIRSLMYFYLVRTFGEVPLILDAIDSDAQQLYYPKSSGSAILNQIVMDLKVAEKNAKADYGNNKQNKARFTKYGINALQADVYLWMEKYDSCIIACNKIINSNVYAINSASVGDPENKYLQNFIDGFSSESIFELAFNYGRPNPFYSMFHMKDGKQLIASSYKMETLFPGIPEGSTLNPDSSDVRGQGGSYGNDFSILKFIALPSITIETSIENWPVYRYSDVLLMKAEALALTGDPTDFNNSLSIIKDLRLKRLASPLTEEFPQTKDQLIDYILNERCREFSFEGKRWFDVLRNAKRNHYERINLLKEMVLKSAPLDKQKSLLTNMNDTLFHYLPINYNEISANKQLMQNAHYQK